MFFARGFATRMSQGKYFFIGGQWVDPIAPGKTFPVVSPATEEKLFDLPLGGPADVDAAVAAAHKAFPAYSETTRETRIALFER